MLDELIKTHVDRLRMEGLATSRIPIIMKAADRTVIEVFEWISKEAIERAHTNPVVLKMWEEFEAVCEYVPVSDIKESSQLFSEFDDVLVSL